MGDRKRVGICFQYHNSGTCRFGSERKFAHDTSTSPNTQSSKRRRDKQERKGNGQRRISSEPDRIDCFFVEYAGFDYDPSAPMWEEFNRMRTRFGWSKGSSELKTAREDFKLATVQQFNAIYGTDTKDLRSWRNLCHVLNVQPVPDDLKQCRQRVRRLHVNLADLVESPRTGAPVETFPSLEKLRACTISTRQFFPKDEAKAGGLLRFLLRPIRVQGR